MSLSAVVVAGLQNDEVARVDQVHQSMFFGNAPGLPSSQGVAELFGLADADERVT